MADIKEVYKKYQGIMRMLRLTTVVAVFTAIVSGMMGGLSMDTIFSRALCVFVILEFTWRILIKAWASWEEQNNSIKSQQQM